MDTSYVVLVGAKTVFPGSKTTKLADITNDRGKANCTGRNKQFGDSLDGTS